MKKLLVATDFTELARNAYVAAASLAKAFDAQIDLVHEAEPLPALYYDSLKAPVALDRYYDQLAQRLDEERQHTAFKDLRVTPRLLCKGGSDDNLVAFAAAEQVDLIVLSTHGRTGLAHILLGSFAERVARHSAVPVLTYRPRSQGDPTFEPRSVLVPLDFSENSKNVFPLVRLLAERFRNQLKVLHVFPEVPVRGDWGAVQERLRVSATTASRLRRELEQLCRSELPEANVVVESRFGDAHREIIEEARTETPDLIIMATHGWTGLRRLYFGSVAEKVLRSSPCSVLTVRPENVHEDRSS